MRDGEIGVYIKSGGALAEKKIVEGRNKFVMSNKSADSWLMAIINALRYLLEGWLMSIINAIRYLLEAKGLLDTGSCCWLMAISN